MKLVFILLAIVVVVIIVRNITKNRNTQESKISAFEHPSTFKKPPIEMSDNSQHKTDSVFESTISFDAMTKQNTDSD